MIRTGITVIALSVAILWCPLWLQLVLFACGVWFFRYRILFLVPAIIADVLYAPTNGFSFHNLKTTLVVTGMLILWYVIMTQTRINTRHVSTT